MFFSIIRDILNKVLRDIKSGSNRGRFILVLSILLNLLCLFYMVKGFLPNYTKFILLSNPLYFIFSSFYLGLTSYNVVMIFIFSYTFFKNFYFKVLVEPYIWLRDVIISSPLFNIFKRRSINIIIKFVLKFFTLFIIIFGMDDYKNFFIFCYFFICVLLLILFKNSYWLGYRNGIDRLINFLRFLYLSIFFSFLCHNLVYFSIVNIINFFIAVFVWSVIENILFIFSPKHYRRRFDHFRNLILTCLYKDRLTIIKVLECFLRSRFKSLYLILKLVFGLFLNLIKTTRNLNSCIKLNLFKYIDRDVMFVLFIYLFYLICVYIMVKLFFIKFMCIFNIGYNQLMYNTYFIMLVFSLFSVFYIILVGFISLYLYKNFFVIPHKVFEFFGSLYKIFRVLLYKVYRVDIKNIQKILKSTSLFKFIYTFLFKVIKDSNIIFTKYRYIISWVQLVLWSIGLNLGTIKLFISLVEFF